MNPFKTPLESYVTPTKILVFDAEATSLHGPAFAIGGVVYDTSDIFASRAVDTFVARCPMDGTPNAFVVAHVLPALRDLAETHATARAMRDAFWAWLHRHADATVFADCGWPVEANLLSACVADDPARAMKAPYPLHDAATYKLALGIDPMTPDLDIVVVSGEGPATPHHPLRDAEVTGCSVIACLMMSHAQRQPMK